MQTRCSEPPVPSSSVASAKRTMPLSPLQRAHAMGSATWPQLGLSEDEFARYATRSNASLLCERPDDLYLCAACWLGRQHAHELFEQRYFPSLRAALQRTLKQRDLIEEVLQDVRSRLLVGPTPKIATYRGEGSLASWLHRIAARVSLDHLRKRRRRWLRFQSVSVPDEILAGTEWSEPLCLGRDSKHLIGQAWSAAVRALEPEQRQLLHEHVVSEQSIDVLADAYLVHRATVARRIQRAKRQVRARFLRQLSALYRGTSGRELEALALDACRQLDIAESLATDSPCRARAPRHLEPEATAADAS